jgi:hypothetical protein
MSVTCAYAEAFFDTMMTRDPQQIAPYVADDAEWLIVGPIELLPYCGQHLGKEAVLGAYGRMGTSTKVTEFTRDYAITDGESASALSRMTTSILRPAARSWCGWRSSRAFATAKCVSSAPSPTRSARPSRSWAVRSPRWSTTRRSPRPREK